MSRLVLIGCGKTKQPYALVARDLYVGALFKKRLGYAEASGEEWSILSALHGIVAPLQVLRPYDKTVSTVKAIVNLSELIEWQLERPIRRHIDSIEVHAGAPYVAAVEQACRRLHTKYRPVRVYVPLAGLGIGQQLAWYKNREL